MKISFHFLPISGTQCLAICFLFATTISSINAQENSGAILTPKERPEPRINGPKAFGVRPGHPILFTIPATGIRPMTFSAQKLPSGVKLNASNGVLSGAIKKAGAYLVTLKAKNGVGEVKRQLHCKRSLAPKRSWNL